MAFLGELWFLRGSPFSLPAYWAIVHARVHVRMRPCIPLLSTFLLWCRLGLPRHSSLSLPVLVRRRAPGLAPVVRGAAAIARAADAAAAAAAAAATNTTTTVSYSSISLFPPHAVVDIDKAMGAAETLCRHARGLLLDAMRHDPRTAERIVLPRFLRSAFFTDALLRFFAARMRAKYPMKVSRDQVRHGLVEMRRLLAKGDGAYICAGRFTYADICLAAAMYFAVTRKPGSPSDRLYGDKDLAHEFNDLVQWRQAIFEKHYPGTELEAYQFAPPVYKIEANQ